MSTLARPTARPGSGLPAALARLADRAHLAERDHADAWALTALAGVAALAAVLYLVNLTVSGYANTYYAMAAQAGSQSWSAWFFGSLDASNFITLDKPPLATMVMGLSVRLFGLSSLSILLPQALMGVATVMILFAAVRRSFGAAAATIAGLVMALTPAAVLIFRYDNPDALLTLLLVSAAAALLRALERGHVRWLALAGTLVGLGFMTKFLQAWLVLPVFALVWTIAAPGGWRRRVAGLAIAAVSVTAASFAWAVAVDLIPAASRPYIGGSSTNSVLALVLGYDGLGRIFGGVGNNIGGGGGGFGGATGLSRMFNSEFGGQVSWLLPFAGVAGIIGLGLRARAGRTDRRLVGYLLWGGWVAVHAIVFSFMSGVIHSYYTVALAPGIAALVGAGAVELWRLRSRSALAGVALAGMLAGSGTWAWALLEQTPDFVPGLGIAVLAVSVAAALLVAVPVTGRYPAKEAAASRAEATASQADAASGAEAAASQAEAAPGRSPVSGSQCVAGTQRAVGTQRLAGVAFVVGIAALLAGPTAYAAQTMAAAHSGGTPSAGPSVASPGPGGGGAAFGGPGQAGGAGQAGGPGQAGGAVAGIPAQADGGQPAGGLGGGMDGNVDATLVAYLVAHAGAADWIVAVSGSGTAASIQLASGLPVMAMGGFNGGDAAPTVAQLQAYVAAGRLRYVLVSGSGGGGPNGGGPNGGSSTGVQSWVTSACTVAETGSSSGTLYDCSAAVGG